MSATPNGMRHGADVSALLASPRHATPLDSLMFIHLTSYLFTAPIRRVTAGSTLWGRVPGDASDARWASDRGRKPVGECRGVAWRGRPEGEARGRVVRTMTGVPEAARGSPRPAGGERTIELNTDYMDARFNLKTQ